MYDMTIEGLFMFDMTDEERAACWYLQAFYPRTFHEWMQKLFGA